jgi:type VI protein secretion system component VasK
MMMPMVSNIKLWLIAGVATLIGALLAVIKVMAVKADLANAKMKAKDAEIKNRKAADKLQDEHMEFLNDVNGIKEANRAMPNNAARDKLRKHSRD